MRHPSTRIRQEILSLVKLVGPYLLGAIIVASSFVLLIAIFVGGIPWTTGLVIFAFVVMRISVAALLGLRSAGGGGG